MKRLSANNLCTFDKNGMRGIMDTKGNVILAAEYDNISIVHDNNRLMLNRNGKYGISDIYGNSIMHIIYDNIYYHAKHGLYIVEINGKYGVADSSGGIIIECIYDNIAVGKYYIYAVTDSQYEGVSLYSLSGKNRVKTFDGYEELAELKIPDLFLLQHNGVAVLADITGALLSSPYDDISDLFNKKYFMITGKDNKVGVMDIHGIEVIAPVYNHMDHAKSITTAAVFIAHEIQDNMKKQVLINLTSGLTVTLNYNKISNFNSQGYAKVRKDNKYGIIYMDGTEVVPCIHDRIR